MFEENDVKCDMQTIKFKRRKKKVRRQSKEEKERKYQQKIIFVHKSHLLLLLVSVGILESTVHPSFCLFNHTVLK